MVPSNVCADREVDSPCEFCGIFKLSGIHHPQLHFLKLEHLYGRCSIYTAIFRVTRFECQSPATPSPPPNFWLRPGRMKGVGPVAWVKAVFPSGSTRTCPSQSRNRLTSTPRPGRTSGESSKSPRLAQLLTGSFPTNTTKVHS